MIRPSASNRESFRGRIPTHPGHFGPALRQREIHLGHLAGAYLPADIYVRYLRLRGEDVLYICGTDEFGVPITLTAEREGITPKELVDRNYASIKKSFEGFGMSFDNFSQTSREIHAETSQAFFLDLHGRGLLKEHTTEQFYSPTQGASWPTATSRAPAPNAAANTPAATSARPAARASPPPS